MPIARPFVGGIRSYTNARKTRGQALTHEKRFGLAAVRCRDRVDHFNWDFGNHRHTRHLLIVEPLLCVVIDNRWTIEQQNDRRSLVGKRGKPALTTTAKVSGELSTPSWW